MSDVDLEKVLKVAGRRELPPAAVEQAVRERLRAEWRSVLAGRRRQGRRRVLTALAASAAAAAVAIWAILPRGPGPGTVIATIALVEGDVRATAEGFRSWTAVKGGEPLREGQVLETGTAGRVALALPGGLSARLDRGSRLAATVSAKWDLQRGAIYVDSGAGSAPKTRLELVTPAGTVRHLGTRYEVRLTDAVVRVRVREGAVELRTSSGDVQRSASGEQLTIAANGTIERERVPVFGPEWAWAAAMAPAIEIEGVPLARFLAWVARETGRTVVFGSPDAEAEVARIVLHGSIDGLTPDQALAAVLRTTNVRALEDGSRLVVSTR